MLMTMFVNYRAYNLLWYCDLNIGHGFVYLKLLLFYGIQLIYYLLGKIVSPRQPFFFV